jgi:hypothetical protein
MRNHFTKLFSVQFISYGTVQFYIYFYDDPSVVKDKVGLYFSQFKAATWHLLITFISMWLGQTLHQSLVPVLIVSQNLAPKKFTKNIVRSWIIIQFSSVALILLTASMHFALNVLLMLSTFSQSLNLLFHHLPHLPQPFNYY